MKKVKVIARPDHFMVDLNEDENPVSVTCEYEGYKYTYTLNEPLTQRMVNKAFADRDERTPDASQYLADCLAAAFFGASRTHHIRNIMSNGFQLEGVLKFEPIEDASQNGE